MANNKLAGYIEEHLKKGFSPDKIKSKLLDAGYKRENIEEAFSHVHKRSNISKIIITVTVLLIIVALIFMVKMPEKKSAETTQASADDELSLNDAIATLDETKCYEIENKEYKEICIDVVKEEKRKSIEKG